MRRFSAIQFQKIKFQVAQAASALMPLALLNTVAATSRRFSAAGPIHHTPQTGRFRYSPLASVAAPAANTTTNSDLLATQILQMAVATGSMTIAFLKVFY